MIDEGAERPVDRGARGLLPASEEERLSTQDEVLRTCGPVARRRREDMGTTLCALVVTGAGSGGPERFGLLNVGDSRAYRLRGGRLSQLTRDHSVVQELIDAGYITDESAAVHPVIFSVLWSNAVWIFG